MNVMLLHGSHRHVSVTQVAIFRVVEQENNYIKFVGFNPQLKSHTIFYYDSGLIPTC